MGTRNLTMVYDQNGETKVAQYGQWDGYPSGVGICVLTFLQDTERFEEFKSKLSKIRFLDAEDRDKEFIEAYNKNTPKWSNEPDKRTEEQKEWFDNFISRDLADAVLTNIANSDDEEIILKDSTKEGSGSDVWIEFCYVINLKENTFSVYQRLDMEPEQVYSLDNLPTKEQFLKDLVQYE